MFPQVFGKYVLERELASGGMAVVYLATLRGAGGFEKRLVVKQIRAELASDSAFVERFVAEAKTTVELSHPNIVPVYELGVEQGVYFIAMELAEGLTLAELLQAGGPVSAEEGAYLGVEICRALDYAHRRAGVVHRDVTPRNVLIDEEGAVRLIDFGIAAPVSVDGAPRERVYGSPGHMPVEQLRGGRLTPATDVFAVGALLVEAWTGLAPFRRATRAESDAALVTRPHPLAEYDERLGPLDDLVARTVSFDAGERPQTAEELARPLREFLRAADVGDIARRLGARVQRARANAAPGSSPKNPGETPVTALADAAERRTPAAQVTPTTRPISQPVTETFATREEVVEWTRAPSVPPRATVAEAPAARPLTPKSGASKVRGAAVAIVVSVAVGAATLMLRRGDHEPPAPAKLAAPEPVVPQAVVPPTPSGAPVAPPSPAEAPSASATSPEEVTRAEVVTLSFTSDLPARVAIDGVAQGTTPLRGIRKPVGRHIVTLVSAELDEHLSATIDPKTPASVSVHAEFTRPVPTLRIR